MQGRLLVIIVYNEQLKTVLDVISQAGEMAGVFVCVCVCVCVCKYVPVFCEIRALMCIYVHLDAHTYFTHTHKQTRDTR